MFKERQEQILLALEMGVDRPLAPARHGGDLIQLGAFNEQLFGKLTRLEKAENDLALMALGPIVSGLLLESYFEPQKFSEKALSRILGRIFDALFPTDR